MVGLLQCWGGGVGLALFCFVVFFFFFRVGGIETAEEKGVSDTESLAFQAKFGPKDAKAQRFLLSFCIGLLRERLICAP